MAALDILGCGVLQTTSLDEIIAFAGTDAYVYDPDYTFNSYNWRQQYRSYTASQRFETAQLVDQMFVVNGHTDAPENYDGSTWSTTRNVTNMPYGSFVLSHRNRIFVFNIKIGSSVYSSRIAWCDIPEQDKTITWGFEWGTDGATATSNTLTSAGSTFQTNNIKIGDTVAILSGSDIGTYEVQSIDSETQITINETLTATESNLTFWVGGNWYDVGGDDGDTGFGLAENSDRLLCFKRFSLYKFNKSADDLNDSITRVKGVPGTTSHRSIVNLRDWTFYAADSGIWRFEGTTSQLMSNSMQEVWDGVSDANKLLIVGWQEDDRIMKMFVGDVNNTTTGLVINKCVMCYDPYANAWWTESYEDTIRCATPWEYNSSKNNYIFASSGEVFKTNTGNDFDGVAIDMEVETPFYFPIAPEVAVNFTRFRVYTQQGTNINTLYKLAYKNGRIDEEWRRLEIINKSQWEQELRVDETDNKASGYALKFIDSSTSVRPVVERIAAYYTGGYLR